MMSSGLSAAARFCWASPRAASRLRPRATANSVLVPAMRISLEVELHADLEQAGVEDAQGHLPRRVVVVLRRHRVRVQDVVQVEIQRRPRLPVLEQLREAQIEL